MIEPVRHGPELVEEMEAIRPAPGSSRRLVAGPERFLDQVAAGACWPSTSTFPSI